MEILFYSKYSPNSKFFLRTLQENSIDIQKICVDNRDVRDQITNSAGIKVSKVPFIIRDNNGTLELYEDTDVFSWLRMKIPKSSMGNTKIPSYTTHNKNPSSSMGKTSLNLEDNEINKEKSTEDFSEQPEIPDDIRDRYTVPKGKVKPSIPETNISEQKHPKRIVKESAKGNTKMGTDIKSAIARMEQERTELEEAEKKNNPRQMPSE